MKDSKYSFGSPSFIIDTDQSNPQEIQSIKSSLNKYSTKYKNDNDLPTFKKFSKHDLFEEDHNNNQQVNKLQYFQHRTNDRSYNKKNIKDIQNEQVKNTKQYSAEIIQLLNNCKISIETLQQQVDDKNRMIKQIQQQKKQINKKLIQSQKQVQRTHQILNIYIKQSNSNIQTTFNRKQVNCNLSNSQQLNQYIKQINNLKSEIQQLHQNNFYYIQQNKILMHRINSIQNQLTQINSQNLFLNQKINKMGQGVNKALTTIKKNNLYSNQPTNQFNNSFSDQKYDKNKRQHGKIFIHNKLDKFTSQINYQTPSKNITQNTSQSFQKQTKQNSFTYYKYQQKLSDISIKAKRIDQIQKLENLLNKMQQLAQYQDNSNNNIINH